jgi:hypothetical protein
MHEKENKKQTKMEYVPRRGHYDCHPAHFPSILQQSASIMSSPSTSQLRVFDYVKNPELAFAFRLKMLYWAKKGGDGTLPTEALGTGKVMEIGAGVEVEMVGLLETAGGEVDGVVLVPKKRSGPKATFSTEVQDDR